jgi:hypothetical protein
LKSLLTLAGTSCEKGGMQVIRAPWSSDPELIALVQDLRSQGRRVVYELPGEAHDALGGEGLGVRKHSGTWQITEIEE